MQEIALQDFINTYKMVKNLIIFDDDNIIWINYLIKKIYSKRKYKNQ